MSAPGYPIRAASRLTGISVDTLRAWERRYQAVVPERGERGRFYRDADIARLRRLHALVRAGHAIGTLARLSDRELTRLIERGHDHQPARESSEIDLGTIISALDAPNLPALDSALGRFASLLPAPQFIEQVALPLMRAVGDRWEAGSLAPHHEHLVSAILRTVLGGLLRTAPRPRLDKTVVFATLAGERHELGLLAAAVLAAEAGFSVVYLGPDLPAKDIAANAAAVHAAAIVVACTIGNPRPQLARLSQLAPRTPLLTGGPAALGRTSLPRVVHAAAVPDVPATLATLIA